METTAELFTVQSLASFGGASSATFIVANAMQHACNFNPRWLALAVAEVICLGVVAVGQIDGSAHFVITPYFVAFLNGFLVFCSAVGMTEVGARAKEKVTKTSLRGVSRGVSARSSNNVNLARNFWTPWFRAAPSITDFR